MSAVAVRRSGKRGKALGAKQALTRRFGSPVAAQRWVESCERDGWAALYLSQDTVSREWVATVMRDRVLPVVEKGPKRAEVSATFSELGEAEEYVRLMRAECGYAKGVIRWEGTEYRVVMKSCRTV
jgi:hypothetical protein